MESLTTRGTSRPGVVLGKLFWVGPLAIGASILADLLVRTIAVALFGVPDSFVYLQAPFIIGSIAFLGVLATLAFALVARRARRPVRLYRLLAGVALLVSFLNPIMALSGRFPAAGMNIHIFWTMIVMHCVAALIIVSLLTLLPVMGRTEH